ncbi:hypothetical protein JRI60_18025 [Archangium violaceum]|uniref:ELWxxDGT repeat protein n=1 Tax=Archangium violaceum TaxID=83451 RepID=UPI00194E0EEA|nr:ELWxxDGT repeat protein [Archangium violaceum]QRO00792.1 hypothetical protein JRI60_18025 [Archangium violaceum]
MRSSCPRARLVEDINEGPEPSSIANVTDVNGKLFFTADDGEHGVELWKSDGTRGGTRLVKDITPGPAGSAIRELTEVNGKLFFAVGPELWKSDGTERGTVRVASFPMSGGFIVAPRSLFEYRGKLVFEGFDPEHGGELWVSDGTTRGTRLLLDFNPGPRSSGPSDFVELDGDLILEVFDAVEETVKLIKLEDWRRVVELADLGDESSVQQMLVVGHRLFVFYEDEGDPVVAVTTGRPGSFMDLASFRSRSVLQLVALKGKVYFQVDSQLWVTDGTVAGTRMVKDIFPGSGSEAVLRFLTVLGDRIYFSADDGVAGRELWVSDGTEGGTRLFADINPGSASSSPTDLLSVHNSKLFFAADDGVHGREPWKLHRGEDAPELLMDIAPGAASSSPRGFIRSDDEIFFAADDGVSGEELWAAPKEHRDCHR